MASKKGPHSGGRASPREVELKLAGAPEAVRGLASHPALAGAEPSAEAGGALLSTYFDTPDGALRRAGLSVRVRRKGEAFIQTVKQEQGKGLVLDRAEWEHPVAGDDLDIEAARGTALKPLLKDPEVRDRLRPVFTIRTERRAFLAQRGGTLVEIVLDEAEIEADAGRGLFGEVELELKHGEPAALFGLARELVAAAPLHLSVETKAARGYALAGGGAPAVKGGTVPLEEGLAAAEAFRRIARSCLHQALANEAILHATGGPAALHQMRVGLRRLRAAASLFKALLGDSESRRMRDALRALSQDLGHVRDLDVSTERLRVLPEAEREPGHEGRVEEAEGRRREAYDGILARLDAPATRLALLDAAAWIEGGAWLSDVDAAEARARPIESLARHELARRWKWVAKRGRHLARLEPEARHRVRIEIKKLRYGAEFFDDLISGKRARARRRRALGCLERLQESLGELNDMAMAAPREAGDDPRTADLLAASRRDIRSLSRMKPFWS